MTPDRFTGILPADWTTDRGGYLARPPRPAECHTDPAGNVRLTVPHDTVTNTADGATSAYCTTLTLTPQRWAEVVQLLAAKLPDDDTAEIVATTPEG